jgi:hypothetical protein
MRTLLFPLALSLPILAGAQGARMIPAVQAAPTQTVASRPAAQVHASAPMVSSSRRSGTPTHPVLPVGWGLPSSPASTVNHPGGFGSPTRGRSSAQAIIVPVGYYPIAVYPEQTQQLVEEANGGPQQQQQPQGYYTDQGQYYTPQYGPGQYGPNDGAPNPASEVSYTLIASKDHSIYVVVDYWLQNNRVNYVTNYGSQGWIAADKIDLELTEQLNGNRKFEPHEKQPGN